MHEILRLDLTHLDAKSLKEFEQLTEPQFRPCLHRQDPFDISETTLIAVGAFVQGQPVGLALASIRIHVRLAEIYSLYVHPEFRHQQIGTQLLAAMQKELKQENAATVSLTYPLQTETTEAFEKILRKNGWTKTRPFMIRCIFTREKFPRHWLQEPLHYPPAFQEFFWKDISEEDKKKLRIMKAQKIFPPIVSPFILENLIEPINSLGLRYEGNIVGWIITHRMNVETIRYSSFYVLPDLRYRGYSIKLLADSIELQWQSSVLQGMLELPLLQVNSSWIHFFNRRLKPHATSIVHLNQAWRTL